MTTAPADIMFKPTRTDPSEFGAAPVVVVGMPRSGSSFMSHLLSQFSDYYVFDDLYTIPKSRELKLNNPLTAKDLDKILFFLGWQIRARLRFGLYAIPNVKDEEVDVMNNALKQAFLEKPGSVLDLQREWWHRLAARSSARKWGFKLPKAFLYSEELRAQYPDLKVVVLLRQPNDVLASYKFIPETSHDGDPGRYHPLFYALYWRLAAKHALRLQRDHPDSTLFIPFHDLTKTPEDVAAKIGTFLDQPTPEKIDLPERPNSSHSGDGQRKEITGLEAWLVNVICGSLIERLGFKRRKASIKISDIPDFFRTTVTFVRFRLSKLG
jgi:hypothetical protein